LSTSVPNLALAQKKGGKQPPAEQPPTTSTEELNLAVGENKTIPATDVKNYSEGTPGIVDVKLTSDASAFVIVGLKAGSTSLLLIKKNGQEVTWTINVFSRSPTIVENELKQLLEGYTGVKVRRVGSRLFIEGSVSSENDVKRIGQIAALYGGQVESLVGLGATKDKTNIRIDFFFVQYERNSGYQLGISYPARVGGEFIQSNLTYDFFADVGHRTSAVASIVNQPLPGLDIASHYGWAKVLKQASVITTNGTDANLDTGGEQNFAVASGLTGTIQKIPFGTNVTVQPFFDPGTRELEVKVLADVSDLTPPVTSATNLPGRQITKVSTIVHMKLGQSLVLSGFHTQSETRNVSGLPVLKDIPIIGILFGTNGHTQDEVEGAVFIIPSVVEASAKPAMDIVNETMKQYEEWSGTPIIGSKVPNVYDKSPNHFEPPPAPPPPPSKK
jgi:pilus assembly protein CpaC